VIRHQVLGDTLAEKLGKSWQDVMQGKGGFWLKGDRFYSYAEARKITGIKAPSRERTRLMPYGDYATIAQINRIRI